MSYQHRQQIKKFPRFLGKLENSTESLSALLIFYGDRAFNNELILFANINILIIPGQNIRTVCTYSFPEEKVFPPKKTS